MLTATIAALAGAAIAGAIANSIREAAKPAPRGTEIIS